MTNLSTPTPISALPPHRNNLHLRFWGLAFLGFMLVIWLLKPMLLPFVMALALAYFLNPPTEALCRRGLSRSLAAGTIILSAILIVTLVLFLIVPVLEAQISAFIGAAPDYAAALRARVLPWLMQLAERLSPEDLQRLQTAAGDHAGEMVTWVGQFLRTVLSGGFAIFDILALIFITPLVAFYVLRDWSKLTSLIDRALPRPYYETIRTQLREIDQTLAGFVRGQALVCLTLATLYAGGLSIIGLEYGAAIGLTAGLLSFIPYVGTAFGWITSLMLGALQFGALDKLGLILTVFAFGQILEGYFLTPKLVGDRVQLHPVWIIFGLFAGASLFGFLGMLIAVPVSAVIGVLCRFGMKTYQASGFYLGQG
jgi:predicted PurR-regulated permease PerM